MLILDEPTSQLDPIAAADFLNTIRKINMELGTTVIITEHRLENVFYCADRVVVMEEGRVVANDKPHRVGDALKDGHNDMFAALPSPMQIYYAVGSGLRCPLTVRDGRNWLSGYALGTVPSVRPNWTAMSRIWRSAAVRCSSRRFGSGTKRSCPTY